MVVVTTHHFPIPPLIFNLYTTFEYNSGKSGCGKSTLLRTLSLVDPPKEGSISIGEQQIFPFSNNSSYSPWPDITVVFQQFFLWPHLTIRRNLLLPAQLRQKSTTRASDMCRALALEELLDRFPNQLSVGQRQRAALAKALLLQPKFLLLDEITSAQDIQHVALMLKVLRDAINEGIGVLVVSHHFGFTRQLLLKSPSSQIVFMESGTVVESGGVECLNHPASNELRTYIQLSSSLE